MHAESLSYSPATLAGGQSLEHLSLLLVTEL